MFGGYCKLPMLESLLLSVSISNTEVLPCVKLVEADVNADILSLLGSANAFLVEA